MKAPWKAVFNRVCKLFSLISQRNSTEWENKFYILYLYIAKTSYVKSLQLTEKEQKGMKLLGELNHMNKDRDVQELVDRMENKVYSE